MIFFPPGEKIWFFYQKGFPYFLCEPKAIFFLFSYFLPFPSFYSPFFLFPFCPAPFFFFFSLFSLFPSLFLFLLRLVIIFFPNHSKAHIFAPQNRKIYTPAPTVRPPVGWLVRRCSICHNFLQEREITFLLLSEYLLFCLFFKGETMNEIPKKYFFFLSPELYIWMSILVFFSRLILQHPKEFLKE